MDTPDTRPIPQLDANGRLIPFTVLLRCSENNIEDDHDGGRVLLQMLSDGQPVVQPVQGLVGCNLVFGWLNDAQMEAFPRTRAEKQQRFFRTTVEELTDEEIDALFPAPAAAATSLANAVVLTPEEQAVLEAYRASGGVTNQPPITADPAESQDETIVPA